MGRGVTAGRAAAFAGIERIGRLKIMIEDLLQPRHLLLILAIALIFFGPQKLPALGKGLAEGIRNFKDSFKAVGPEETRTPTEDGQGS
jgi:sec-independent protein translocase protein TatA